MKTGWQTAYILAVGIIATAAFYIAAVRPVQPEASVGSGKLFLPPVSAAEQYLLTYSGTGTLRTEVQDERSYLELLFEHDEKGLSLSQYMAETSPDGDLKLIAESMTRRYRYDLLQVRVWLREWYGIEKPLPGKHPLAVAVDRMPIIEAQRAFADYMLKHHNWVSAMSRVALEKQLRPEITDFARQIIRIEAVETVVMERLRNRL